MRQIHTEPLLHREILVKSLGILSIEALELEKQLLESGELTPELEILYDTNKAAIANKLDSYYYAIENMHDKMTRLKDAKKQLDQMIKTLEKNEDYLVGKLENAHRELGSLKGQNGEWVWKCTEKVEVDPEKLPVEFVRVKIEPKKDELKKALKEGPIEGAQLIKTQKLVYKEKK